MKGVVILIKPLQNWSIRLPVYIYHKCCVFGTWRLVSPLQAQFDFNDKQLLRVAAIVGSSDRSCCELPGEEAASCFTDCCFQPARITSASLDFWNCEISSRLTWYFCPINFIMFPGMKELKDKPNPPFSCIWPPAFGNFMPFSKEIIFITTLWCHKAADCHAWGLSHKSLLYILTHDGYNGQIMCFPF